MDDAMLLQHFERARLHDFSHAEHVRVIYLKTLRSAPAEALDFMRAGLRQLTEAQGVPQKYHETMTVAWSRVVRALVESDPTARSFDEFVARYPQLLRSDLLLDYYSPELLFGPAARSEFVEPDLKPLPGRSIPA
jgi:hypothetical protein